MPILSALPSLVDLPYRRCVSTPTNDDEAESRPAWADAIRERRLRTLKLSQEGVAANSGDALSQTDVSRLERGRLHPVDDLPVAKFFGLLTGYGWTLSQFEEETGLELPFTSQAQAEALEAASYLEVSPTYEKFPVYYGASAGDDDPEPIEGGEAFIPKEKLKAKGADPRFVRVFRVNGDCMISEEARLIERNIVHGDHVAVDTRRRPRTGETVVAWWPADRKLVVKRYKVEREGIVLYPLAPAAPTLVLPHEDDANIIGTVIWREG